MLTQLYLMQLIRDYLRLACFTEMFCKFFHALYYLDQSEGRKSASYFTAAGLKLIGEYLGNFSLALYPPPPNQMAAYTGRNNSDMLFILANSTPEQIQNRLGTVQQPFHWVLQFFQIQSRLDLTHEILQVVRVYPF